jgi:type IV pilus assembly protein PilQ
VDKVPFLGDLPFLGRMFRRDVVQDKKSELLVFLTPRIMNNQAIAVSR